MIKSIVYKKTSEPLKILLSVPMGTLISIGTLFFLLCLLGSIWVATITFIIFHLIMVFRSWKNPHFINVFIAYYLCKHLHNLGGSNEYIP